MKQILLFFILIPYFGFCQWTQVGNNLNGESLSDEFGSSVSMSADGTIVAVGAEFNSGANGSLSGHVQVYQNIGGTWTQIGLDIDGEAPSDGSGRSISLSANGSIVAIGAPGNDGVNGTDSGHVRVYQNSGGTWTQVGTDIDGEAAGDELGHSVSISADGSIVAIGAPINDGVNGVNSGHVRVYQNISNTWTQIGADIDGEASNDRFGDSISLNADGSIVAIGATRNDATGTDAGHVRVYQNNGGTWTQLGADFDGNQAQDYFGYAVSLNDDGNVLAIGATRNDANGLVDSGHVKIFLMSGVWFQIGEIKGEGATDGSGNSVSLSADGSLIAIGAQGNDSPNGSASGHVRVYQNSGGAWTQVGLDIDGHIDFAFFGRSVNLSADGTELVIGGFRSPDNAFDFNGHARIYENPTLSISDYNFEKRIKVYPNPVTGSFQIESIINIDKVEIYSIQGQLIKSFSFQNQYHISDLFNGLYFIKVISNSGSITKQIIKK